MHEAGPSALRSRTGEVQAIYGVVVTRIVLGTISTHVVPGRNGIRLSERSMNSVGEPRVERCQVPGTATPSRYTTASPLASGYRSALTSKPPWLFSTQGPYVIWTYWTTTLATVFWVPFSSRSGVVPL